MIKRIIVLIVALGLLAAPLQAQERKPDKIARIGYLSPYPIPDDFRKEMRDLGWVEGQNMAIEYRSWAGKRKQLPDLATELVDIKVDIIFSVLTISTHAAKNATNAIPIIFNSVADPVGDGFVASFTQPGSNITGVCNNFIEISGKVLQLLTEAVPEASRVAYLWNPVHGRIVQLALEEMQAAANTLGVKLQSVEVREAKDFEPAFAAMVRERAQVLAVLGEQLTFANMPQIVELALKNKLPMMVHGPSSLSVEIGALMSYAPLYGPQFRRGAHQIDKILKGAKPADLPVELPTHYAFVINLKTAGALGLTIPQPLLMQATEVIE
jgi:putative ABC transport system substrate-binding protein